MEQLLPHLLGFLSTVVTGLFLWVFNMHAKIAVLTEKSERTSETNVMLTDALVELKIVIARLEEKIGE
jgi:ABC-type sugar transport system permease subunit